MKATTTAVTNLINAARTSPDVPIAFAECFTFTTTTGAVYTWTSFDVDVPYAGYTYLANGPMIAGLKFKQSAGLDVDKQQVTIAARPTDVINGAPFLVALREGAFDGAEVQRDRVFLTLPQWWEGGGIGSSVIGTSAIGGQPGILGVVGGVTLFKGKISTVDNVGRTQATLTVASDLVILDYDMPRNLFSPTCLHTLYDSGCGVIQGTYSANGTAALGSTSGTILSSVAQAQHAQGSLAFISGANANVRATVKTVNVGVALTLMYPLPFAPEPGDAFMVAAGCDHTQATCSGRFNNIANFRGFPYVPPPDLAY